MTTVLRIFLTVVTVVAICPGATAQGLQAISCGSHGPSASLARSNPTAQASISSHDRAPPAIDAERLQRKPTYFDQPTPPQYGHHSPPSQIEVTARQQRYSS